jgi:serine/threonine protein kinase
VADLTQLLKEASISRPQPQSLNAMLRDNYPLLQEYVKLKDVTAVVEMYTSYKEMVRLSTKAVCAQKKLNIGARLGTMFSVYSGSQNGSPVIIKKVSAASMEFQMAALFRDHDSIVQIDNSIVYNDSAMLVMSKYPCSLFDAVVTDGDLLFTGVISMVEALNHVHSKGVVHMDVKPHNIFVTQSGVWLLGDFGSATFEGEKISTTTSKLLLEPVTSGSTSAAYKFDWQMLVVGILHMVQASQVQDGVSITPLLCEEEKYHASKVKCLELLRAFPHSRLQQLLCQLLSCQMQTFDRDFAEEEEDKDSSSSSSSSSSPQ